MLIYTMNTRTQFLAVACAMAFCASLHSQVDSSSSAATQNGSAAKPQKSEVTKLDGTKYFGFVEVTDDYTIRVTNDSGIMRLPIAQLGDNDFQKYGFQKDRGKDGRFWYERKEALQSTETNPKPDRQRIQTPPRRIQTPPRPQNLNRSRSPKFDYRKSPRFNR